MEEVIKQKHYPVCYRYIKKKADKTENSLIFVTEVH